MKQAALALLLLIAGPGTMPGDEATGRGRDIGAPSAVLLGLWRSHGPSALPVVC